MDQFGSPRNTTKNDFIENFLVATEPRGIEAQEAQGQRELVNSQVLPTEIIHSSQADMEELGFIFGEKVAGDEIFRHVELPEGWSKKGSDHSMWSYVVDERGIDRVGIFYKAAFYDRSAHMQVIRVGRNLASNMIYSDAEIEIPEGLTVEEVGELRDEIDLYLERADAHPTIYDRKDRALAILERVDVLVDSKGW